MVRALRAVQGARARRERGVQGDADGHLGDLVAEGEAALASPGGKVAAMAAKFSGARGSPPPACWRLHESGQESGCMET